MSDPWSPLNPGRWTSKGRKAVQVARAVLFAKRHGVSVTLLDVGARGGPNTVWAWAHRAGVADLLLVEPDPSAAAELRAAWPRATVVETALDRVAGERSLHITAEGGRSSFLRPLRPEGPYAVQRTITVPVAPLCELSLRPPDLVKIDVQGAELEVLAGFGAVLDEVVGIELEVAFQVAYEAQPTIGEVNDWMGAAGFVLVDLRPLGMPHGIEEGNAFYAREAALVDPRVRFWRQLRGLSSPGWFQHRI